MRKEKQQGGKNFIFDIQTHIDLLLEKFPLFGEDITFQNDKKYGKMATLIMKNEMNPRFPLIVTMYAKEGVYLDMGRLNTVIEHETDMDEVFVEIHDILEDRVFVTVCYRTEEDFKAQKNYTMQRFDYYETGEPEGGESFSEYQRFLEKLGNPLTKPQRPFALYKNIIETSNWSGSAYKRVER